MSAGDDFAALAVDLVAKALPGAEVEATSDRHRLALTRFANSGIHQNVAEDSTTVRLRVHHEGRSKCESKHALPVLRLSAENKRYPRSSQSVRSSCRASVLHFLERLRL